MNYGVKVWDWRGRDRKNIGKVSKMDFGNGEKYVGVHGKRGIAKRNVKRKGRIENIDV